MELQEQEEGCPQGCSTGCDRACSTGCEKTAANAPISFENISKVGIGLIAAVIVIVIAIIAVIRRRKG